MKDAAKRDTVIRIAGFCESSTFPTCYTGFDFNPGTLDRVATFCTSKKSLFISWPNHRTVPIFYCTNTLYSIHLFLTGTLLLHQQYKILHHSIYTGGRIGVREFLWFYHRFLVFCTAVKHRYFIHSNFYCFRLVLGMGRLLFFRNTG
jgi:hypothetical protein